MEHFAGIDVSLELSSVCVVDGVGKIVHEAKVASDPEALVGFFRGLETRVTRIGLEAGPLSQWLYAGLVAAGFEVVMRRPTTFAPAARSTRSRACVASPRRAIRRNRGAPIAAPVRVSRRPPRASI